MLVNQNIVYDGNEVRLRNTFDIGTAKKHVAERNKEGGEGCKSFRCLGHIPPEMWHFDPWLIAANKARFAGDRQEYARLVQKFFELRPAFKIEHSKRIWGAC